MWTRKDLKARAKISFKANYWKCVLVSFIMILLVGSGGSAGRSGGSSSADAEGAVNSFQQNVLNIFGGDAHKAAIAMVAILGALLLVAIIAAVLGILVFNPLKIGGCSFYVKNAEYPQPVGEILSGFKNGYCRNIWTMILKDLFIALGFCCLIIPGIIFLYGFRMVPYILAEDHESRPMDVLRKSRALMTGERWRAFILDLSFILWELLAILTLGILNLLYVNPYKDQTCANLYIALRDGLR